MDSCSLISGHRRRPGPPEELEVWAALLLAGTHYAAAAEIPSGRIPSGRRKRLSKKALYQSPNPRFTGPRHSPHIIFLKTLEGMGYDMTNMVLTDQAFYGIIPGVG